MRWWSWYSLGTSATSATPSRIAWDDGIPDVGFDEGTPDWSLDPLTTDFVRDDHLRAANGPAEDGYIDHLIKLSLYQAERVTWRTVLPKEGCRFRLDTGFPAGYIVIPRPPLISVESIDYVDGDGVTQSLLGGSPQTFAVSTPFGPTARKGRVAPLANASWPSTFGQMDAVTVHLTAGYANGDAPQDITHGRLLLIGEMYKQRSDSVHSLNNTPAVIRAVDIFKRYRAYG